MSLRRSLQQAVQQLRLAATADGAAYSQLRGYARLPGEYAQGSGPKFPKRLQRPAAESSPAAAAAEAPAAQPAAAAAAAAEAQPAAAAAGAAASEAAPAAAAAAISGPAIGTTESIVGQTQRESARVATNFMFPWERRQMEGGKLKWWEKAYWGVFVAAMALFIFNRIEWEKEPPKVDEEKEARKAEMARAVLAGKSFLEAEAEFKGMSPEEIQEFVGKVTQGAKGDDPFEGMTPEEINEYVAKHGMPAGMQ